MTDEYVHALRKRFFTIYNKLPICQTDIMVELKMSRATIYRFMNFPDNKFSKKSLSKILIWVEAYEERKAGVTMRTLYEA